MHRMCFSKVMNFSGAFPNGFSFRERCPEIGDGFLQSFLQGNPGFQPSRLSASPMSGRR
jgi:hypothetical protein